MERKIINLSIKQEEIQLFAPDIFWDEIERNLILKLGYDKQEIESLLSNFVIIKISRKQYSEFIEQANIIISHKEDAPFIATALFLNCPIWSGNEKHFSNLTKSGKVIWFNTRKLFDYLNSKNLINKDD